MQKNIFYRWGKEYCREFKLLEIAIRLSGSFSLSRCLDENMLLMALKDFDGQDVEFTFNNIE